MTQIDKLISETHQCSSHLLNQSGGLWFGRRMAVDAVPIGTLSVGTLAVGTLTIGTVRLRLGIRTLCVTTSR